MVTMFFFLNVNGFAFGQVNVVVDVFVVIIIVLYYLVYFGQNSGTKNKERGTQMAISLGKRWPKPLSKLRTKLHQKTKEVEM